jgi:4-hydroxy-tetrahydrodipicolinate synthase
MTEAAKPRGLWVAALTPLTAALACDTARLAEHCRYLFAEGCDGVALFGTTGEGPSFTVAERRRALETVLAAGIPAGRVILGTGCAALPDTIELTRAATEAGCAGTLVLPPFFFKGIDGEGVFRAFAQIIEGVADPRLRVYLYNIPSMSAVGLDYETIARLAAAFPRAVAGVKDSSLDWSYTAPLLARFPGLDIFVGAEHHLPQALEAGGAGTICGLANIVPGVMRALYDAAGPQALATPLARIEALLAAIAPYPFVSAVKAIAAANTGEAGWRRVRAPLHPLTESQERALLASLASPRLEPATA